MNQREAAATALAGAFLAGDWDPVTMGRRGKRALADRRHWITHLAHAVIKAYPDRPDDGPRELARFIAAADLPTDLRVHRWMAAPGEMRRRGWWPALDGVPDLAAWLGVTERHLDWFADRKSFERTARDERLRHYRRRWIAKADGSSRLIEAPKTELKDLQRRILHGILARPGTSPPLDDHARAHAGQQVLIRCDLEAFFSSIPAGRVYGVFRRLGYPEMVAHYLAALCTTVTPVAALRRAGGERHRRLLVHLTRPHLPQGAPTSSALAGLCTRQLDRRLSGLADRFGARYSRYVDDLIFSGDAELARGSERFLRLVATIVTDEGYRLQAGKTRVRTAAQRQTVLGRVVNTKVNAPRRDYDRLKAVLHHAATAGHASANRENHPDFRAHLLGRIAWISGGNPTRAAKLEAAFARIAW